MGVEMKTKIIYEDDTLLVICKPAGLATQTSKIGQPDVVSELKNYLAGHGSNPVIKAGKAPSVKEVYLGVVHRLDQPVEGLLVFGKTKEATAKLSAQLAKGTLNKQYYAVVGGQLTEKSGKLVDKLYKTVDNFAKIVTNEVIQPAEAKDAILQYTIIDEIPVQNLAQKEKHTNIVQQPVSNSSYIFLADIHIETGRFHQIRAQMAHHGMALLGDSKYADEETGQLSRKLFVRNVALCAYFLEVVHPVTGKKLSFQVKPEGKIFQGFQTIVGNKV